MTNLTGRLGELVDKVTSGPVLIHKCPCGHQRCDQYTLSNQGGVGFERNDAEFIALCFTHKGEILSALRKAEEPVSGDYAELVERLREASEGLQYRARDTVRQAATAIERLTAREAELRDALRPFGRQKTIEEIMAGEEPAPEWVGATPERRIELMGERKRENTTNILRARLSLGDEK